MIERATPEKVGKKSPFCSVPHTSCMMTAIFSSEIRFCDEER